MCANPPPGPPAKPSGARSRGIRIFGLVLAVILGGIMVYSLVIQEWLWVAISACLGSAILLAPPGGGVKGLRSRLSLWLFIAGAALFIYLFVQTPYR
jgi:hypothetical protein